MEVAEAVDLFTPQVDPEEKCTVKNEKKNWKARINKGVGSDDGPCTGARLYDSMGPKKKTPYMADPKPWIDKSAPPSKLADCKPDHFPVQAHHLIPKNHLPDNPVCAFLGAGYTKHPDYKLQEDTNYDCDSANNGYCMPYATPLAEWQNPKGKNEAEKTAAKQYVAFQVMEQTGRQLHQGSHRAGGYGDDELDPSIHVEGPGYLNTVDDLLKIVQAAAQTHPTKCSICSEPAASGKKKIYPREAVVRHVDQVSGIIKALTDSNTIFVSKYAWRYWKANKLSVVPDWLLK